VSLRAHHLALSGIDVAHATQQLAAAHSRLAGRPVVPRAHALLVVSLPNTSLLLVVPMLVGLMGSKSPCAGA
jgi:hypothetical protein